MEELNAVLALLENGAKKHSCEVSYRAGIRLLGSLFEGMDWLNRNPMTSSVTDLAYSGIIIITALFLTWRADAVLRRLPRPAAIGAILAGYFALMSAFCFLGGAIDQARLQTVGSGWLAREVGKAAAWGSQVSVLISVVIGVDTILQDRRLNCDKDVAYYPLVQGLVRSCSFIRGRLVLIAFLLLVLADYTMIALQEWAALGVARHTGYVFQTCVIGWAALWIADCVCRPRRGTVWVPIVFLVFCLLALPSTAIFRE